MVFIQRSTYASSSIISLFSPLHFYPRLPTTLHLFRPTPSSTISAFLLSFSYHGSSFYFIPLLPSFVKHSSNHRVQQTSFERSLGTREGLVEDFRAVYAIVQFSWIILFGKFQRNLFQRGVSLPCVPLDSTVSALILLRGLILCPEKGTRNTARTNILSLFASMRYRVFLKGEELDILNLNRVIRIMAKIVR